MQNVLITGISGGIGSACCEAFLRKGYSVIGISRNTEQVKERWKKESFHGIDYDLMSIEGIPSLVKDIIKKYGNIRGFVHCAGFDKMIPLSMNKPQLLEDLWRIHAEVPMLMIPQITKKGNYDKDLSIVLISSQSAHEGAMGHSAYASAKGAIEGYLPSAAAELMEKGIRINALAFSPIKTKMAEEWMEKLTPDNKERLEASYPLGIMNADDASGYVTFLVSEESRHLNGQLITVDSGHMVRKP